jgi:hypothetical protein
MSGDRFTSKIIITAVAMLTGSSFIARAADAPVQVAEPTEIKAPTPRTPQPEHWSWDQPDATFTPTGDLVWAPHAFGFEAGKTIRYIDFGAGSDDNDGASKEKPWKHHPWDPAATGHAKEATGNLTYVFKRGVVYRGTLTATAAGAQDDRIRLTSDPSWGDGEAVISGSETVTGWTKGTDEKDIPDGQSVWWVDLPYSPRNVWQDQAQPDHSTKSVRVNLAREPNWTVSDPETVTSEWWKWEQPMWWTRAEHIQFNGHPAHIGIDTKHLTKSADYYVGADVRTEFGIVMGTPFPTRVEGYDPQKKGIIFQGIWLGDSEMILTNNHYYLEDKPQYLDSPGEFWFEQKGEGGRLYLRLPGDADPNQTDVEVAHYINLLDSGGLQHVSISGLTFANTNTYWDLTLPSWGNKDVDNAAIRVNGPVDDLTVSNCKFEGVARAVLIHAAGKVGTVEVRDNDIQHADHGGVLIDCGQSGTVRVLRNRMFDIGGRPQRQDWGHALIVQFPVTEEIAGNMLDKCYGSGIFCFGGKPDGSSTDVPLERDIIHDNRATNTLLAANDWGGIETWQGGPHYLSNNISGNANGHWWAYDPAKGNARLGYNFYFDGSHKNYLFNNVAWGLTSDPLSQLCNAAAINEATATIENSFFNNTFYDFAHGSNWSPVGGRHLMLGNIWANIPTMVFQYGQLKEDTGPRPATYDYASAGIGSNVFAGVLPKVFGVFQPDGTEYPNAEAMSAAMIQEKALIGTVGKTAAGPVMKNPDQHDFRPIPGSDAIGHGVKVFVPWALSREVGEWHFHRNNADPTVLLDDHWYMTPYYVSRGDYFKAPTNPLTAVNITEKDYSASPLSDWTDSALSFNGKDQYATLTQADMTKPYNYAGDGGKPMTAEGKDLATPDIDTTNLLIEAHFRTAPGSASAVLLSKIDDAGYQVAINKAGGITLVLKAGGQEAQLASGYKINDGNWHHVLIDVDRSANTGTIYIDGGNAVTGPLTLPAGSSLSNSADFLLAKGPSGDFFSGSIDFLRICRGDLADAGTTIEELYDWEFAGPFLRDLRGTDLHGAKRDAGAFQAEK